MSRVADSEVEDLVRRAVAGESGAWEELVAQYSGLLWSVVRTFRLGEHQAADVVQTTWLRLVEHIGVLRDPKRLGAWLVVAARNNSIDAIRQAQRLCPLEAEFEIPSADEPPEAVVVRFEQQGLVREACARLSERDQDLLSLLTVSPPISYEEIGEQLGMPVGSIGPTRMRALRRLRAELEHGGVLDAATR